ncbi:MAG: hypothetical protein VKJ46_07455, partial [Leptolyngbyaceae bacterium]|nr:hypothetical protein [Leptolyngbyaceae bacterium]
MLLLCLCWGSAIAQTRFSSNNLITFGSDAIVAEKQVVKNVTAIAGSVKILNGGYVTGDAVAIGGDVALKSGVRVDGDVSAIGGAILKEEGVTIGGSAAAVLGEGQSVFHNLKRWGLLGFLMQVYLFSAAVYGLVVATIAGIGIVVMLIVPDVLPPITAAIDQFPLRSGLWGLGATISVIMLTNLTTGSLLGTALLPVVNLLVILTVLLGAISMGRLIGHRIPIVANRPPLQQFLVGMLILALVGLIPVAGGLVLVALTFFGFGGVLFAQLEKQQLGQLGRKIVPPKILEPSTDPSQEVS